MTEARGFALAPRLTIYPEFATAGDRWLDPGLVFAVGDRADAEGLGRDDPGSVFPERTLENAKAGTGAEIVLTGIRSTAWYSGADAEPPTLVPGPRGTVRGRVAEVLAGVRAGQTVGEDEIVALFAARGPEVVAVAEVADDLRRAAVGDTVTYVRNRNINYTNVCTFKCRFCGFSKGPLSLNLRGTPYLLTLDDIAERSQEAWERGATEVCLQGGIHPDFDGDYYIDVARAVRDAVPGMHIHGFTALEVTEGAKRLGEPLDAYLRRLMDAGLRSLPGTAAEILDDDVRAVLCPDKITTEEWLEAHRVAHGVGLRSNVTIMFGAIESPRSWARHLLRHPRPAGRDRRVHRVRRPAVRPHGGADLPAAEGPAGPDVPGGAAHARGGPHHLPRPDRQRPALVGEAGRRGGRPAATGRVQRPGRHADGREHLPGRRGEPRPGDDAGRVRRHDRAAGPGPRPADDPLRSGRGPGRPGLIPGEGRGGGRPPSRALGSARHGAGDGRREHDGTMTYHLGIDLGTTYTAAATGRDGRVEAATLGTRSVSVPSVVCLAGDQILVGEPAARRAVTDPGRVAREFKRRVGDPTPVLVGGSPVSAEMLMARVVDWVVTQVAATEGGRPASLAVTHPANWGEYKLDLLRQALRHVGVPADRFVPEPVAAATAYAHQRKPAPGTVVAVYDLGGGTFDAAVLRSGGHGFEIVGRPDGIERLGGIDFDHAVIQHVLGAIGLDLDRFDAEDRGPPPAWPSCGRSASRPRRRCPPRPTWRSRSCCPSGTPRSGSPAREFEAMIRPALDETVVCLRRAIASAGLAERDLATVLLVGGSSRIPSVSHLVGAELGVPVAVDARPKDAIALGAALVAMRAHAPAATAAPRAPLPPPPPGGSGPYPPAPAGPGRRALVAVLAVLLVAAGAAGAQALLRDGSGGEQAGGDPTTTTGAGERTTTTTDTDDGVDSGELDLGSSDRAAPALLPGDDWSDAARAQFVADCADQLGGTAAGALGELDSVCGCAYDTVSTEVDFASFKAIWSAEDVDTSDPTFSALMNAFTTCSVGPG